jgi:hypothetical protein
MSLKARLKQLEATMLAEDARGEWLPDVFAFRVAGISREEARRQASERAQRFTEDSRATPQQVAEWGRLANELGKLVKREKEKR